MSLRAWLVHRLRPWQLIDPGADVQIYPLGDLAARQIVQSDAEATGAALFDLESTLRASPTTYRYRSDLHSFYEDNQHLTLAGGQAALTGLVLPKPWNK
jgi:hypothetical protein